MENYYSLSTNLESLPQRKNKILTTKKDRHGKHMDSVRAAKKIRNKNKR